MLQLVKKRHSGWAVLALAALGRLGPSCRSQPGGGCD